jgi:hypothetical protein
VQQAECNATGRSARAGCDPRAATALVPFLLLTATAAVLLSGCTSTGAVTTSVSAARGPGATTNPMLSGDLLPGPSASNVTVSPNQHHYLDALTAAGIHPSSDLQALSIGSYVCQARAAGQSDQAVWAFVMPLVRGDVNDVDATHPVGDHQAPSIDAITAEYIRIATDRLC